MVYIILLTLSDVQERITTLNLRELYLPISKLGRTGWVLRNIPEPETVAEHQIHAALMVTQRFRREIESLGLNLWEIQDTFLIHDIAEGDLRVWDITPFCGISTEDKYAIEEIVICEMLGNKPYLLHLWINYKEWATREWRMAKEIDKLQAIEQARHYENMYKIPGLVEEFYTRAVVEKGQITTDFLLRYAGELYENKPR